MVSDPDLGVPVFLCEVDPDPDRENIDQILELKGDAALDLFFHGDIVLI